MLHHLATGIDPNKEPTAEAEAQVGASSLRLVVDPIVRVVTEVITFVCTENENAYLTERCIHHLCPY